MTLRGRKRKKIIIIIKEVQLVPKKKLKVLARQSIERDHHHRRKTHQAKQINFHRIQKTHTAENLAMTHNLQRITNKALATPTVIDRILLLKILKILKLS